MVFFQCAFKTDVLSDRSEATLKVSLDDGRSLLFKLAYLECLVSANHHIAETKCCGYIYYMS